MFVDQQALFFQRNSGTEASPTWNTMLKLNATSSLVEIVDALPACTVDNRGSLAFLRGGTGVADKLYACMKTSIGTYAWVLVAVP
jgi:hypothetical protein